MAYPYDQGMPPGYGQMDPYGGQAPGMFGATMGGLGFGAQDLSQQQAYAGTGAAQFGMGAAGGMSSLPVAAGAAFSGMGMLASMGGLAGMQSSQLLGQGMKGFGAVPSMFGPQGFRAGAGAGFGAMGRQLGYGAMRAADVLDPFSHVMSMGGAGARGGGFLGRGVGQVAARMAPTGMSMFGSTAAMSTGARMGIAGAGYAGAGMGAIAGAALPLGAGMAAYAGLEYAGKSLYQGASDVMQGQGLMNELGSSVAPGQNMKNQGATTGRMMRDMSEDMGSSMEDIGRFAKQLNSQRVFQTTSSAKEFRDKFKEVMGAVKEIAQITQGSVDDAMKMFTDLRQQGFYTTADIKSQAASRQAREMTTGISAGVYSAIGGAGSQMARQYGLRGRVGADLAERNVAGVAMGVRSGAMSEEEVQEMGGAEAVGMRQAQQQMGFLKSSRGRAMIAYSMGEGGAPDPDRLNRLMRGTSMEDIVTGAAGRGLGVMQAAGGREAQEKFAPYAGMAMVQMAAAQQKQLYGGVSQKGIEGMLGTMGVGRQEAQLMLQQTMQMPAQLAAEQRATSEAAQKARYEELRNTHSLIGRAGRQLGRSVGDPLSGFGADVFGAAAGAYGRAMTGLTGGEEYSGGDEDLARRHLAAGGTGGGLGRGGRGERSPLLGGVGSASRRLGQQYGGLSDADVRRAEGAYAEGLESGAGKEGTAQLRGALSGGGDIMARMRASRQKQFGEAGAAGSIGAGLMNLGLSDAVSGVVGSLTGGAGGTEKLSQLKQRHDEFFLAQEAGLVDKNMSLMDFVKKPVEERMKISGQVAAAVREAELKGDSGAKNLAALIGSKEAGLLDARNIQATRDDFKSKLTSTLTQKFGSWGGELRGVGSQKALASELTTNGKARAAYDQYVQAISRGDDASIIQGYSDELRDALGGEDSQAFKAAADQRRQLENMSPEERKAFGASTTELMGQRAYLEKVHRDTEGLKKRMSGIDLNDLDKKDPRLAKSVQNLTNAARGDPSLRKGAMEDLILGSVSGGISDVERDILNRVGGAGQGESIAKMVSGLQKGDKGVIGELGGLQKEGGGSVFGKGELEAIKGIADPEKQAEAIAAAFKKAGLTDTAMFGKTEGGKDIRGVQTEYVEANEKFVNSVWAFVSALEAAGIKVEGPGSRVGESAQDVTAGGNSGGSGRGF